MQWNNFRLNYFLIIIQSVIILITFYKLSNTPSETYWILAIVLCLLIIISIISILGNNNISKNSKSSITNEENRTQIIEQLKHNESNIIPEKFEDSWELPL